MLKQIVSSLLLFCIVSVTGCTRGHDVTELRVGLLNRPFSLQSWHIRDAVSTLIGSQMHRGLLAVDPATGRKVSSVAERYEYLPDRPWIRFYLRQNLRFHDGSIMTCQDAKLSFDTIKNKGGQASFTFPAGTVFQCEADNILLLKLPYIPAQLLDILASPAAAISKGEGTIGLGPYALVSNDSKDIILIRKSGDGPSILRFIIDGAQELERDFRIGKIDDLLYLSLLSNVKLPCQVINGLSPTSTWLSFNSNSWAFRDRSNRLVVRDLLRAGLAVEDIFSSEVRTSSLVPLGVIGNRRPSRDPDSEIIALRAKLYRLVKHHGRLTISLRVVNKNAYHWEQLFDRIDSKRELFRLEYLDNRVFFEKYYAHQLSAFFVGANVTRNDPFEVLSFFRSRDAVNPSGVREDVIDRLADKAANSRTTEEIKALAIRADQWIISEGYALPLFSKRFHGCVQDYLDGYVIGPLGPLSVDYSQIRRK